MGKCWEKETLFFPRGWSTKPYGLELQNVTERGWMGFMSGCCSSWGQDGKNVFKNSICVHRLLATGYWLELVKGANSNYLPLHQSRASLFVPSVHITARLPLTLQTSTKHQWSQFANLWSAWAQGVWLGLMEQRSSQIGQGSKWGTSAPSPCTSQLNDAVGNRVMGISSMDHTK